MKKLLFCLLLLSLCGCGRGFGCFGRPEVIIIEDEKRSRFREAAHEATPLAPASEAEKK